MTYVSSEDIPLTSVNESTGEDKASLASVLACPVCRVGLIERQCAWECPGCGTSYPAADGFVRIGSPWRCAGELPRDQMQKLLKSARESSWERAVADAEKTIGTSLAHKIIGKAVGDWFFEVPWKPNMRTLNLASGWGELSFYLAQHVGEVYSLEEDPLKSEFQTIRREQETIDNVVIVNSKLTILPFKDETFDLIALNTALERIGGCARSRKSKELLRCFLLRVRKMLAPAGSLYLTGANQFWNLIRTDHRNGACSLPRTSRGYRRLLAEAGFSETRVHWVLPDSANPFQSARVENARALRFFARTQRSGSVRGAVKSVLLIAASRCGVQQFVTPQFSIAADANGGRSPSLLELVCESLRSRGIEVSADDALRCDLGRLVVSTRNRYINRTRARWVLFDRRTHRPAVMVKIPRYRQGERWLSREQRVFSAIAERFTSLRDPPRTWYMRVGGVLVLCEKFFLGVPFKRSLRSPEAHGAVMGWLSELHASAPPEARTVSVLRESLAILDHLFSYECVEAPVVAYLQKWVDEISQSNLTGARCVAVHGDFTPGNIMLSPHEVFVTDWEWAQTQGCPWEDFWAFELSCAFGVSPDGSVKRNDPLNALALLEGKSVQSDILKSALREFLSRTGLARDTLVGGLVWTIVRRVVRELDLWSLGPRRSRYYRLLALAARKKVPLWDSARRLTHG